MHLAHDGSLTCTHSIAECVTALASEASRLGADYVCAAFDAIATDICNETRFCDPLDGRLVPAMESAMRTHDPFQNGGHVTWCASHVGRDMAIQLGAESL